MKINVYLFKRITAAAGALTLSLLGVAGFYDKTLPDNFSIERDGKLELNTFFSISSRPVRHSCMTALTGDNGSNESTLMLLGAVPVKNVTAVSSERPMLVPCGETFGIKLLTDGVIVVELTDVGGRCPARECGIRKGDIIISVNGRDIRSNRDITDEVRRSRDEGCEVVLRRGGTEKTLTLVPAYSEGSYKAGMWVRDSSAGIGTLTFFDDDSGIFGGLGHPVCDSDTGGILPLSEGAVGDIDITGLIPSEEGSPGQLLGDFSGEDVLGEIKLNCEEGLFGTLENSPDEKEKVELGYKQEVHRGSAQIYSSVDGGAPKPYSVQIEYIDLSRDAEHDMVVHITDESLISETGGIVQGMSGSPIMQDGRLVGAVTHVFIDDPTRGYGIFAEDMFLRAEETTG
ncbi:SpoIVB peptidase [Ruminococcus albus]|uniref:Stage IV sporulation protein B n=1 Tax=Ruminococcus albus (strain ATCC 27210 / DSM 20455 / JCM 14654 / NCDO 2250 / 7) TaxID=697329 RepID=E6UBW1_RUMA7|nr:SpoIVB peptidase [Ruminococcus albus]ADU21512.1 stage IV sporulation protein B [Ruminococcus albus 7 = DSM 20455]